VAADVAEFVGYNEDSASPLTITKPAAFASGQRLAFVLSQDSGLLSDITLPSGWTAITGGTVDIASQRIKGAYHDFTGTEPSTWDFGYNGGASVAGVLVRITGADLATAPVCATGNIASNLSSMDSPSVTPTGSTDLLITTYSNQGGAHTLAYTAPSGMTNLGSTQVAGGFQCIAAAKQQLVSGSATGAKTWTGLSPTGGAAGTFSIAIKSAAAAAGNGPQTFVASTAWTAQRTQPILLASQPLGNPAVPTPGPLVVSPQSKIPPVPGAVLLRSPSQPGAPGALVVTTAWSAKVPGALLFANPAAATPPTLGTPGPLVVSPPFGWAPTRLPLISSSQPLGNPAVGTTGPLIVSAPWSAKVPGALLFTNPAAAPVAATTTPGPLVVTPPFTAVPIPTSRISASQPLGNPAVPTPQPLVISTFTLAPVPGAKVFGAPAAPLVAAAGAPAPLVVTPPWRPVPVPHSILSASLPLGRPAVASPQPVVVSPPQRWPAWTTSLVSASPAATAHLCITPRPDTGTTARPGSGTTVYSTATTARPSTGITARPDTGITEDPC
jgi:hypothetical protein